MLKRITPELLIPIAIALLSLALSAYSGYSNIDKSIEHRLTAVEKQQENDLPRLERMENKLDRLVTWALGAKP